MMSGRMMIFSIMHTYEVTFEGAGEKCWEGGSKFMIMAVTAADD